MPFTNNIVDYINSTLEKGKLSGINFTPVKFYNVAGAITREQMVFPGVTDENGEIEEVVPDDLYNISIYHKVLGNTYTTQKKGSYGDEYDILSTTEMQAFIFAQSDKIKLTAEQLEPYIIFGIPAGITTVLASELRIKACNIIPLSSDMDKIRVFKSEFQGVDLFLKPEHVFFSIRYSIKMLFDRSCLDLCTSCGPVT